MWRHENQELKPAVTSLERFAATELKPLPFHTLHDWYLSSAEPGKAQDALERGVAARDASCVVRRVKYVHFGLPPLRVAFSSVGMCCVANC